MRDLEKQRATQYRNNHSPQAKVWHLRWRAKRTLEQKERDALSVRNSHLRRRYGLTQAAYDALLVSQNNACAICGTMKPGGRGVFQVDHDHASGRIRGLLCYQCNAALGYAHDDPGVLESLASYVRINRQSSA